MMLVSRLITDNPILVYSCLTRLQFYNLKRVNAFVVCLFCLKVFRECDSCFLQVISRTGFCF